MPEDQFPFAVPERGGVGVWCFLLAHGSSQSERCRPRAAVSARNSAFCATRQDTHARFAATAASGDMAAITGTSGHRCAEARQVWLFSRRHSSRAFTYSAFALSHGIILIDSVEECRTGSAGEGAGFYRPAFGQRRGASGINLPAFRRAVSAPVAVDEAHMEALSSLLRVNSLLKNGTLTVGNPVTSASASTGFWRIRSEGTRHHRVQRGSFGGIVGNAGRPLSVVTETRRYPSRRKSCCVS